MVRFSSMSSDVELRSLAATKRQVLAASLSHRRTLFCVHPDDVSLSHTRTLSFNLHVYSTGCLWSWSSWVSLVTWRSYCLIRRSKANSTVDGPSTIHGRDLTKLPSHGKLLAVHVCLSVSGGRWRVEWSIPTAVATGESRRRDAATSRRVQRVARCGHWRLSSRVRYSIAFNFSRLTADDIVHLSWRGGLKNNKISCASGCEVATPSVPAHLAFREVNKF